jgi:hypothetical protein
MLQRHALDERTAEVLSRGRRSRHMLIPVEMPAGLVPESQLEWRETRQLISHRSRGEIRGWQEIRPVVSEVVGERTQLLIEVLGSSVR